MDNYQEIKQRLDLLNSKQRMLYSVAVAQILSPFLYELADEETKQLFNKSLPLAWKIIDGESFFDVVFVKTLEQRINRFVVDEIDRQDFIGDDTEWDISRIISTLHHFFELFFEISPTTVQTSAVTSLSLGLFSEIDFYLNEGLELPNKYQLEEREYQTELEILETINLSLELPNEIVSKVKSITKNCNRELAILMPLIMEKTERWMDFPE